MERHKSGAFRCKAKPPEPLIGNGDGGAFKRECKEAESKWDKAFRRQNGSNTIST